MLFLFRSLFVFRLYWLVFIGPNYCFCKNGWHEFMTLYVGESCRRRLLRSEAFRRFTTSPAGAKCQPAGGKSKDHLLFLYLVLRSVGQRSSLIGARSRLSVHCDAAHPHSSSGQLGRARHHAVVETCAAACIDAQAHSDLAAQPITFCVGRRSSWSISTRCSSCISASGACTDSRWHMLAAHSVHALA